MVLLERVAVGGRPGSPPLKLGTGVPSACSAWSSPLVVAWSDVELVVAVDVVEPRRDLAARAGDEVGRVGAASPIGFGQPGRLPSSS